jgi:hypothetical protein
MQPQRAIEQLDAIHAHLARTEVYRGYRSIPVGLTGAAAVLAAIFQPHAAADGGRRFVAYWVAVAALNILGAGVAILWNHFTRSSVRDRRRTVQVVGHFIPPMVVGLVVTLAVVLTSPATIPLLPGLWALIFALGLFASRPHLPHAIGWIAVFYVAAGARLLTMAPSGASLEPWAMGGTFACGQVLTALALYWNLERQADAEK